MNSKKIALVGPECSGKTTLAAALRQSYEGVLVTEYARTYFENNPDNYTKETVYHIATMQKKCMLAGVENALITHKNYVFFDTSMLVITVWLEYKYNEKNTSYMQWEHDLDIQLYLLCSPDIDWQPDAQREHPNERHLIFECYKSLLDELQLPYVIIKGATQQRQLSAIESLNNLNFEIK